MNLLEIENALIYGEKDKEFHKNIFKEGRSSEKWEEVKRNPFYIISLESLLKSGDKYLGTPITSIHFSSYKIYDTTGSRREHQKEYFDHRNRLYSLALLSLIYGETKYLEALEDAIWAVCDEYTWCLPAHLGGKSLDIIERPDKTSIFDSKTYVREHDKVVDLYAAETGYALTEICELLEDKLAPIVVHRARKRVMERVLEPYCELNSLFGWETRQNNWAAVCAGCVGITAIYLIKDSDILAPIILKVLSTMDSYLSGFAEDGACTEGLGYWNYGFGNYIQFTEVLRQRTSGKIDGFNISKVKQIALFQQKCYMSEDRAVTFSDSGPLTHFNPGYTSFLKEKISEVSIPSLEYRHHFTESGNWGSELRNFVWSNPDISCDMEKRASYYLPDAMWLISRIYNTKSETFCSFAAKGGNNNEPHNHNDIGSFILQLNNEQILIDIGSGEYTKSYFGPERYTFLCNGSQGHSVPVIDGAFQQAGKQFYSVVTEQSSSEEKDIFEIEMAKAYQSDNLLSLLRRWEFQKSSEIILKIKDKYRFVKRPKTVVERFVSHIEPKLVQPGKVEYKSATGTVFLTYNPDIMEFGLYETTYYKHSVKDVKVYCADLKVKVSSTVLNIDFEFSVV